MRSRYKFDKEKGLYFITSTIVQFIPIFTSEKYCNIIIDSLKFTKEHKNLKIIAYVIMDNHFHTILEGENLSDKIRAIKGFTAHQIIEELKKDKKNWALNLFHFNKIKHKINSDYQVWQEGVHPQLIENHEVALQKINYIHNNPVKQGLVAVPEHWVYSSASNYLNEIGILEIDRFDEF